MTRVAPTPHLRSPQPPPTVPAHRAWKLHRPAPPETLRPREHLSRTDSGLCPPAPCWSRRLCPRRPISWSSNLPPSPSPSPCRQPPFLEREGGAVLPPRVTWSRPPHPPDGIRGSSIYPSSPRPPAQAGNSGPTAEPPARELVPALSQTPCHAADEERITSVVDAARRATDPDAARAHPGAQRAEPLVRGRTRSGRRPRPGVVPDSRGGHRPDAGEDTR